MTNSIPIQEDEGSSMVSEETTIVREGLAEVELPSGVFYNHVQEFNRSLTIASIKTWYKLFEKNDKKVSILEGLAASGLRSVRYVKEMASMINIVVANDMSPSAVETIKRNIQRNNIDENLLKANHGDAIKAMHTSEHKFNVIDLDPYGTASPFIDAAVQNVEEGGLLCITCTDAAVLCGKYPETAYAKYGGVPVKNTPFCHEFGLRLLLQTIQSSAARYKRVMTPLMSCSIDFYFRVFVRIETSAARVKECASNMSMVSVCPTCKSFSMLPLAFTHKEGNSVKYLNGRVNSHVGCQHCGTSALHMGGPVWNGPLHSSEFVNELLAHIRENKDAYATHPRMLGMVTMIQEELNGPFYFVLPSLCSVVHVSTPQQTEFASALLNAGYHVSRTHCNPDGIKTDAPIEAIWRVLRAIAKKNGGISKKWLKQETIRRIMRLKDNGEPSSDYDTEDVNAISFQLHKDADPPSRRFKLVRFEDHQGQNWGPKSRPKRQKLNSAESS